MAAILSSRAMAKAYIHTLEYRIKRTAHCDDVSNWINSKNGQADRQMSTAMPELSITEANYAGCCEHQKGSLIRPPDVLLA
ncbi:hypothetical protein KC345_g262 [Hortaea werneckii]|nr:hypothetical protein KC345_g262 [Hortaea werneckii]